MCYGYGSLGVVTRPAAACEGNVTGFGMAGLTVFLTVFLGLVLGTPLSGTAAEFVWTMQSFQSADDVATRELQAFAERLKTTTDGRLDIQVLPAGAVVPNEETPRAINAGLLQAHYNTPSFFARIDPAFAVLGDTLAAYRDPDERDGWFYLGDGLDLARKLYAKNGLYLVGPVYWPADWMPAIVPLNGIADLRGLKVRSPGGLVGDLLRRAGAVVTQLPTGRIHDALETGVIDATDWANLTRNRASGLYDVAPYNTMLRHSMVVTEISVGMAEWEALPEDLQATVESEVQALSGQMRTLFVDQETKMKNDLAASGVTSIEWDDAEARQFRALLVDVWGTWRSKSAFAARIVDSHRAYMKQLGLD